MKAIKVKEITEATGAELIFGDPELVITGVEIDSRNVKSGDLFFALPGERVDGNDYAQSALEKGAACAVVTDRSKVRSTEGKAAVCVKDAEKALRDLAKHYIKGFDIKKVGITGSNGKTTTKDMLYSICSVRYKTHRTPVNKNNLIGLPLTVLSMPEDTEAAVFEMGMDAFGEVHTMCDIVRPDTGIITNVGTAHIEKLGSREGILRAKLEMKDFFGPENTLVIADGGDVLTRESAEGGCILVTCGRDGRSNYIISDVENRGEDGMRFMLEHDGKMQEIVLKVPGEYNVINASMAIAAAGTLGITMEEAAKGLLTMELAEKRMNIRGANGLKVIDDTYNASPPAMKVAIDVLMSTKGIRKVAILGDMFELGEGSREYHREVGEYAGNAGVEFLIGIGNDAKYICEGAAKVIGENSVLHFEKKEDFAEKSGDLIKAGDVILVKGSRGMAMETIVRKILE